MDDPTYLASPVQIIADPRANAHDLLDAYATFSNRIRSQSLVLHHPQLAALASIHHHKDGFLRALRRDIHLAHSDPLSFDHPHPDAKQYAADSSALCHHALSVLATIFHFPALHLAFIPEHTPPDSMHDLSSLFRDVLDVVNAHRLPVLNESKTYSLSLWALSCHRLPAPILASHRDLVFSALQRSLSRPASLLDGLKAVSHTIDVCPSFLDILSPLLPHVISTLYSESSELRLHASITLGKFANALVHQIDYSPANWRSLSNHITSYLGSCCDDLEDTRFLSVVHTALFAKPSKDAPTWILAVVASLIVLCGPQLYRKPTVLRLILQALAMTLTHKRSTVRALHPHVWRCFVWTFGRMLFSSEIVDPAVISSAFYVIRQEVRDGIGIALATILLSDRIPLDERDDRISQALSVVKAMVQSECKHTRREGLLFLQVLGNRSQARRQILWDTYQIPALALLNGDIIGIGWDRLPSTIRSIPKAPVSLNWLNEAEIARHYKTLLVIWRQLAVDINKRDVVSGLVDIWSSILLACSHELGCGQQIAAATEVLMYTSAMIVEFLPSVTVEDSQPDQASHQLYSLAFIDQLWSAMQKAFVTVRLAEAAALILASILKYAFHALGPSIQMVWSKLCVSLMMTAPPSFLCDIRDPSQLVIRSQRELWGVIATSMSSSEPCLDWKELIRFIAIPICTWALSGPELEVWKTLFQNAITVSGDSSTVAEHFVLQYFQGKEVETWNSAIPVLGFLLACTQKHGDNPADELLSTINVCLTVSYNQARHSPEALVHCLELLSVIRHMVVSAPDKVVHILQILGSSLCLWIEDHSEVMSDDEYNTIVASLYCEALEALRFLPLSIKALHDLENFLSSTFSRIPAPAIGPLAFEQFWRATYHGRSEFYATVPPKIKSCLGCFVAAFGGDLADGLSLPTESQSQSIRNRSEAYFSTSQLHNDSAEFSFRVDSLSTRMSAYAEGGAEVPTMQAAPREDSTGQDDTTFLLPSSSDGALQPTILRQLQEYSSRMASPDDSEQSMSSPQICSSPPFHHNDVVPSSHTPEKILPLSPRVSNWKRKLVDKDDAPEKRSRTSQRMLRIVHKSESEPASRDVTPIYVPRTNSMPLKKRMVFDGVYVPTLSQALRQRRANMNQNTSSIGIRQGLVSGEQIPTFRGAQRKRGGSVCSVPPSVGSDEDDLGWEDLRIDATSSEADIDRSLGDIYPTSPPRSPTAPPLLELDDGSHHPSALSEEMSQGSSLSSPDHPSLQRTKMMPARLDALQDIYSSIVNGGSQIPMSELLQATRLVHQIGAVLTEKMDKKMGGPG